MKLYMIIIISTEVVYLHHETAAISARSVYTIQPCTQTPSTGLRHPSTTAEFSYAVGSRKLSANEQFFVGTQTVVSLL